MQFIQQEYICRKNSENALKISSNQHFFEISLKIEIDHRVLDGTTYHTRCRECNLKFGGDLRRDVWSICFTAKNHSPTSNLKRQ